ncbi:EpsG family [Methylophilaceae bacterium]
MQILIIGTLIFFLGISCLFNSRKYATIHLVALFFLFFITVGFNTGGGWDFDSYRFIYENIDENVDDERIGYGYSNLLQIADKLGAFRWLLVLSGLLSTIFLFFGFNSDNKKISVISLVFFLLSPAGLLHQISEMRQGIAVCILTAGICFLYRKQYALAFFVSAFSFLFHSSALVMALIIGISYLLLRYKIIFAILAILTYVFRNYLFDYLADLYPVYAIQILSYVDNTASYGKYYFIITFCLFLFLFFSDRKKPSDLVRTLLISLLIFVVISIFSYNFGRASNYLFGPLIYIYFSSSINRNMHALIKPLFAITVIFLVFLLTIFRAEYTGNLSFNNFELCFLAEACK